MPDWKVRPTVNGANVLVAGDTITVVGQAAADAAVSGNPVLTAGRASAAAPAAVSADGDVVTEWRLLNGAAVAALSAAGALIGGDAANGLDVDVTRLPALVAGSANIGDVDVLTLPAVAGAAADDAAISGSPVPIAFKVGATEPKSTPAADGDSTYGWADGQGRQVILNDHPPALAGSTHGPVPVNVTAGTPGSSLVAAPGAGLSIHVTGILVTNAHATAGVKVSFTEGSAGTARVRGYAAAVGGGFSTTPIFPAWKLPANTALFAFLSAAGDVEITVHFYVAP